MFETQMPFGVAEFCFPGRSACPVRGCVETSPCPTHHVAVYSTRGGLTYVYDDPWRNLLWTDADDRARLDAILRGKRESRMGHEQSEEVVRDGCYELLRNWVLDTNLREALRCENSVLVNLTRKRHESDHGENPQREFAEHACVLSSDSQFVIAHWGDLISAAPSISRHPDSDVLVRWARNKSELLGKPAFDF